MLEFFRSPPHPENFLAGEKCIIWSTFGGIPRKICILQRVRSSFLNYKVEFNQNWNCMWMQMGMRKMGRLLNFSIRFSPHIEGEKSRQPWEK